MGCHRCKLKLTFIAVVYGMCMSSYLSGNGSCLKAQEDAKFCSEQGTGENHHLIFTSRFNPPPLCLQLSLEHAPAFTYLHTHTA